MTKLDQVLLGRDILDRIPDLGVAMVATLNLYEAKTQFSKLVERAAAGEEIVIAKAGKPMARLVPVEVTRPTKLREPGLLKGKRMAGGYSRCLRGGDRAGAAGVVA